MDPRIEKLADLLVSYSCKVQEGEKVLISYEGESAKELIQDFHDAVDDYLELCVEKRIEPEKAYKGSFNVRISPDLHRSIAIQVIQDGMTLNKYVEEALQNAISAT